MHLLTLNAAGKPLAPPKTLAPTRRRLSQVIGRHVDRTRPHMIAVQRARDPLQPIEEAWVTRGRDKAGNVKPWPRTYLPADAIVVVVYLPRGGGGSSSGSRSKSPLSIALSIAAVALVAFAAPIAGAIGAAAGLGTFGIGAVQAGLVLGGAALLGLASRSKANKTATDTTQIYGVAGGGNLPKPGDRIPRGYGRSWMKPDLSQPDFSQYDGDDQILFKRHTLGLGKYEIRAIRAGKQVIWQEDSGFVAPFNDSRNAIERTYGTASTLIPNSVVSASGIGGLLPRPEDLPAWAGPFPINQRGALVSRLQVDFQFPQGISRTYTGKTTSLSNQKAEWWAIFQYAPIDESGAIIGPWQAIYDSNSGIEGARFATHPLRYTKFVDVPPGRYAVRARNGMPDTSGNTAAGTIAAIDALQWDGASGWVSDAAIREGITEICLRIYATKATQAAGFSEIEVDAQAVIPVWTGTQWVEQETSKAVWAFLDIMRNPDYGGALPDSQLDLGTALGYANSLTQFDTFDGTIRGPVSVYEAAATVLLPMRAEPVHLGRYWSLVRDEPKAVRRHMISRRQMLKGSTQISFNLDTAAGAGHVIGEFDQDGDYRNPNQTTAVYGEASLTPMRQRWTGVRTFEHAQHLTRWRAACGAFRRQTTPFGVEMEGRLYKRGDSISIDVWFVDRQFATGVVDSRGDTLILESPVDVPVGYAISLRDRSGREWGPMGVVQGATPWEVVLEPVGRAAIESATGMPLSRALSDGRGDMTTVIIGPVSVLTENYLIQSVKPNSADTASVEAVLDDQRVWQAIGAPIVVPPVTAPGIRDPETPHIVAFTANAVQIAAGLRCDYAISPGRGAVGFEVGLSYDDGSSYETIYTGTATTGSQVLNPVDPTTVMLRARAFGGSGLPGPYIYTLLDLPRAQLADGLIDDALSEVQAHFAELDALVQQALKNGEKILADAQSQLASGVQRLRQQVQEIAEAAATVEGNTYERNSRIKVALQGRTQDAFAAIDRVDEARVSDKEAFAQTTTTLATRLGTAEGAITTETTSRSAADEALTGQITTAYSRLDSADLKISGQASATQGLTTRVSTSEGNITSLSQNYTTLNSQLTTARGDITNNATAISQLTTRTSNVEGVNTSQATQISGLIAAVNDPSTGTNATASAFSSLNAQVQQDKNDPTNGWKATVDYVKVLNTQVQGNQATLGIVATSANGTSVKFGVTGNINGQTGGFSFTGVRRNDDTVQYNVEILGGLLVSGTVTADVVRANTIYAANIVAGEISTTKVAIGAITQSAAAGASGNTAQVSLFVRERVLVLAFFPSYSSGPAVNGPNQFTIYRDGVALNNQNHSYSVIRNGDNSLSSYLQAMAIMTIDVVGAGVHTYSAVTTNSNGLSGHAIYVTELAR